MPHQRSRKRNRYLALLGALVVVATTAILTTAANAAPPSQFTLSAGTLRPATGRPAPASGTQASLWGNDSTATTVVEGSGRVLVGAIGEFCGEWPRIALTVDGVTAGTSKIVDATRYGTYPIRGSAVGPGRHTVVVHYVNDYRDSRCDRNVHLSYVRMEVPGATPATITRPSTSAAPTPVAAAPTGVPPAAPRTTVPTATGSPRPTQAPETPPSDEDAAPPESPEAPIVPLPATGPAVDLAPVSKAGVPGPTNTGVPKGTILTRHDGDLVVRTKGAVIDGLDIHGFLVVEADDVTVRNSLIRGREPGTKLKALVAAYGDHRNFTIEDSTLRSDFVTPYMDGLKGRNFTARRLDISNVVDTALVFGDNVVIEDSWLHGTRLFSPWAAQPDNKTHNDNVEIVGGKNILLRHNTFEGAQNAAVMITQDYSRSSDIRIVDNHMSDGNCTVNIAEKGKGPVQSSLTGNRFGESGTPNCAVVAKETSRPTMVDNVWAGTNTEVEVRRRPT